MEAAFEKAGLHSAEELHALGAQAAYAQLLASGHGAHSMAYRALAMGLQGRPWQECTEAEKTKLRAEYDEILANRRPAQDDGALPADMARALDAMGVRKT